ncbi:MAG: TspO/MBR family protein [Chlamydiota bacterium]|nr:TspO/MBR family protein [Chlamydiota bacterium]
MKKLLIWVFGMLTTSMFIGWISRSGIVNGWYASLPRSPLTPPSLTFRIVWPTLYVMIAVAGWRLWSILPLSPYRKRMRWQYSIQLLLNWLWSPLFFYFQFVMGGLITLTALLAILYWLMGTSWCQDRTTFYCLLPYGLWSSFALYLNGYIFWHLP